MKKQLIVLSIAAMTSSVAFAVVGGAPVANQFSAGQPARAADVNENFQELANRIDTNNSDVVDNVADIATNATDIAAIDADLPSVKQMSIPETLLTRKFVNATPASAGVCNVRNDVFVFDTGAKTFELTNTFENSTDQVDCNVFIYDWDYNSDLVLHDFDITKYNGSTVDYAYSMSPGWTLLKDKMIVGESWGTYSARTISVSGGSASATTPVFSKQTFLGYHDITVAAGAFTNCILIQRERWLSGVNDDSSLYYYCSGPGLTRHVDLINQNDWQLESYTTQ